MSARGLHLVLEPQLYRQSTKVENKGSHFPSLSFVSSFCHFFSSLRLFTLPFHFSLRLFSVSRSASLIHERSRVRRPSLDQFQFVKHVKSLRFGKRQKAKKKEKKTQSELTLPGTDLENFTLFTAKTHWLVWKGWILSCGRAGNVCQFVHEWMKKRQESSGTFFSLSFLSVSQSDQAVDCVYCGGWNCPTVWLHRGFSGCLLLPLPSVWFYTHSDAAEFAHNSSFIIFPSFLMPCPTSISPL